jgi:hypothetical protein
LAPKFAPWQPASQGRLLTSVSVVVSMNVSVAVSVLACTTYSPVGTTGVWIGSPPIGPVTAPLIGS